MAKLTGPLMSESAHGKLGKSLIYSKKQTGNIARGFHMPGKEPSLKQWTQRHIIGLLTAQWQTMTAAQKLVYENLAITSKLNLSGFNYFVKVAQADLYTHHGLCGYWSMNESTGNQVLDYSGNKNHGTLMPTYPTNCPTRTSGIIKQYGNALNLNGTSNYVDAGNASSLQIDNTFTVMALVKVFSFNDNSAVVAKGENGGYFIIRLTQPNLFGIRLIDGIHNIQIDKSGYLLNTWYHLAFTVDGRKVNGGILYVNGKIALYLNTSTIGSILCAESVKFGLDLRNTSYFHGILDEVRIYNRVLSAPEILKHYNILRLDKKRQPLLIH